MRIVCIADTHGMHECVVVPECDVLVHAGDMTMRGDPYEMQEFDLWCGSLHLDKSRILVCAGNHDFCMERGTYKLKHCTYLFDSSVTINGVKFYGSPWQPAFFDWAFNLERDGAELRSKWAAIPEDTDVLVTHGPPYGVVDLCDNGHVGCKLLFSRIMRIPNLKLHICGHIHEGYGVGTVPKLGANVPKLSTTSVGVINASACDGNYIPCNKPLEIELCTAK